MYQGTKIFALSLLSGLVAACQQVPNTPQSMTGIGAYEQAQAPSFAQAVMPIPISEQQRLEQDTEKYQKNEVNPVFRVSDQAISTFSIDVDTGSYSNTRRFFK